MPGEDEFDDAEEQEAVLLDGSYPGYPHRGARGHLPSRLHARAARPGARAGGVRQRGERHGLTLDPAATRRTARRVASLQRHPDHADASSGCVTERTSRGWAGKAPVRAPARTSSSERGSCTSGSRYEDALPVLAEFREHGVKIGVIANGSRDLQEFVAYHGSRPTASSVRASAARSPIPRSSSTP